MYKARHRSSGTLLDLGREFTSAVAVRHAHALDTHHNKHGPHDIGVPQCEPVDARPAHEQPTNQAADTAARPDERVLPSYPLDVLERRRVGVALPSKVAQHRRPGLEHRDTRIQRQRKKHREKNKTPQPRRRQLAQSIRNGDEGQPFATLHDVRDASPVLTSLVAQHREDGDARVEGREAIQQRNTPRI